jgi:FtsH-binding integral membrane protein
MGGAYNGLLLQLALVGSLGMSLALAAVAWGGAGQLADGSVLAARIGERLPALPALLVSTCSWFALGERIEPEHVAASLLLTLLCLVVSAVLLGVAARFTVRLLVGATFTVFRPLFSGRAPAWVRRTQQRPITLRSPLLRRRFARSPPIANDRA